MRDALSDAINAPAGRLAEVLIKRLTKGENGEEMPYAMRQRFDRLASATGRFGELARVRFAAEVALLCGMAGVNGGAAGALVDGEGVRRSTTCSGAIRSAR